MIRGKTMNTKRKKKRLPTWKLSIKLFIMSTSYLSTNISKQMNLEISYITQDKPTSFYSFALISTLKFVGFFSMILNFSNF